MNIQTSNSNAEQRRKALLHAIGLILILMIFTGFGVSLYPTAQKEHVLAQKEDCSEKKASLQRLEQQQANLESMLKVIESQYEKITIADTEWENAKGEQTLSSLKDRINGMEDTLDDQVNLLNNNDLGPLSKKINLAYGQLLVARKTIWKLRDTKSPVPGPPVGGTIAAEILAIASDLDRERRDLNDNSPQIVTKILDGFTCNPRTGNCKYKTEKKSKIEEKIKATVNQSLNSKIQELQSLVERLRAL